MRYCYLLASLPQRFCLPWRAALTALGMMVWCCCPLRSPAQHYCATDLAIRQALQKRPALSGQLQLMDNLARRRTERGQPRPAFTREQTVTIPVVVHVVLPDPALVSDAQILSQIAVLNTDYTAANTDISEIPAVWRSLIGNLHLQFCLAQRTPDGLPTNGIVRSSTDRFQFGVNDACPEVKHAATGGSDAWDTQHYLNIWICNLESGYLGVTTPPGLYSADEDGVVIQYNAFGTTGVLQAPYDRGRTATHEVGHYLGLLHPWGLTGGSCSPGDNIDDTPPQSDAVYGHHAFPYLQDPCSPTFPGVQLMNFMEYVDDTVMHLFTTDQTDRMDAILTGLRAGLLQSEGCMPVQLKDHDALLRRILTPSGKICDAVARPEVVLSNLGKDTLKNVTLCFRLDRDTLLTFPWSGAIPSADSLRIMLPPLTISTGVHRLTVFTRQPDGHADQQPENDTARISFHLDPPATTPFSEGFEGDIYPPPGWDLKNPDGRYTWELTTAAAHSGNTSAVMPNFDYASNGPADDLLSPVFRLPPADSAFLFFDLAAAVQSDPDGGNTYWDTLEVLISFDCGQTTSLLYRKWGRSLITDTLPVSGAFVPGSSDWRQDSVDLTAYIRQGDFQLIFRNITNFENNIYLDDIRLVTRDVNPNLEREKVLIVPNPTTGLLQVEFISLPPDLREVAIYDAAGRLLMRRPASGAVNNRMQFDLANAPNGIYFVKVLYQDRVLTRKIIKVR
ncbi:M43 family zinc metalloprotease [Compostibacter hankyongensis]|uniref:T9SS type A sorting domain-containing protein n=1 Tax=Compostibacter hankyongensis TaxID=1007089 RepID=A0ABP8G6D6_9BACT